MTYREKFEAAIKLDKEILTPKEQELLKKGILTLTLYCPGSFFNNATMYSDECGHNCEACWAQEAHQ